jgi:GT2 family glycosyltransferase
MMQKIFILMPVHGRCAVTERFIDCLVAQTYPSFELVLIDDGSRDGTRKMVEGKIKNLTVLSGTGNWWWAGSLQQGINLLKRRGVEGNAIVMFANDDITFEPEFLKNAVDILNESDSVLLLPHVRDEISGVPQESGVHADLRKQKFVIASSPDEVNCLSTRGLFMRMKDLRRIGDFHPRLLPHYWSDYEFTIRARRKGLSLRTSAAIAIGLDHSQTGFRELEDAGFAEFFAKVFSKRATLNPVYQSMFILLASPVSSTVPSLFRLWSRFSILFLRKLKQALAPTL